ncbi:hypothetical protein PGB90_003625 [Kerria lacca]
MKVNCVIEVNRITEVGQNVAANRAIAVNPNIAVNHIIGVNRVTEANHLDLVAVDQNVVVDLVTAVIQNKVVPVAAGRETNLININVDLILPVVTENVERNH